MVGEVAKFTVLSRIAAGASAQTLGRSMVRIGWWIVHVRFRSAAHTEGGTVYRFGLNPRTLTADLELWICGSADTYYLIPKTIVHRIYNDPSALPDHVHTEIRFAEINARTHKCLCGQHKSIDLSRCISAASDLLLCCLAVLELKRIRSADV